VNTSITRHTLPNGLLVLLKEIHTAPLISHWVWYRVGSRDENPGITGASHWVEHMQFKGTTQFPPGALDKAISRQGGLWNAFTHLDWTTYFETTPAAEIDLVLQLEADRMVNSTFDHTDVESERTVIISERQGNENDPLFRLGEQVQQAAFQVHNYRHQVIGELVDLQKMGREDLYGHYRRYYIPNNAVLALAGDFETDRVLDRLHELYAPIPPGDTPPRNQQNEPPQSNERYVNIEGPGETTYIQTAYRAPAGSHPDFFALIAADSLLTGPSNINLLGGGISNKTSRLYRALIESELAVSVHGSIQATLDPYLYTITAIVHPGKRSEDVLQALEAEIQRLQQAPPDTDELRRAVKQARALFSYGGERITNQAFWMGISSMIADTDWVINYLDNLAAITPDDVQHITQNVLHPDKRILGVYQPTGETPKEKKMD
jgi:zinc protease